MSEAAFTRIESERLRIRRFKDSDLSPFMAYRNDPEVARYQSWDSLDEQEARAFTREMESARSGVPGEGFQFAIESKEMGDLIGDCALRVDEHEPQRSEIGFTLAREHQGKGFASEAVSVLLDYAFGTLGLHRVVAIADCRNAPSVALLERVGMRREGHFLENVWFKGGWADEYLYAVLKDEWLRQRPITRPQRRPPSPAASRRQGPSSPAVTSARPMEISSARTPTPEDRPREMRRRPPGPPDLAGNHLTRTEEDAMDQPDAVSSHNREAWDAQVERGNRWTVPVDHDAIEAARRGRLEVLLTDSRRVPAAWFPDLDGADVLCFASGGGQQGPLLAAAGANVSVLDNSPRQLARDRLVAERQALPLRTVEGDMKNLSEFADGEFDLVFHPVSNLFVPEVRPVWTEAFRVLRKGGTLLAGFVNPAVYAFDLELADNTGELRVEYQLPYADPTSLSEERLRRQIEEGEPLEFGHTLEDQIGGQIAAGFVISGFYEDRHSDDPIADYMPTLIATRATKP